MDLRECFLNINSNDLFSLILIRRFPQKEMIRFMECWRLDCILARLDEWEYILMSSTNCDRKVFGLVGVGISVTYSKKRIGLRELP